MKPSLTVLAICVVLCTAFKAIDNIISKLGMQEETARYFILKDFTGRFSTSPIEDGDANTDTPGEISEQTKSFQIPDAKLLAAVISGDKRAAAKELCEYVKAYVTSPEFLSAYQRAREAAKPVSEPYSLDAASLEAMKASVAEMEKQYETLKATKQVPEASLEEFRKTTQQMKAKLATQGDPTPNLTRWNKLYPEDPAVIIKARLNEYLQLSATVDFGAQLTGATASNRKFVNPAYEKQSLKWKAIYRAGKDVNEVASAFAKEWLKGPIVSR
ncbi:MAG TPA: hypothetical protein VK658_22835 [Chryseolinea sp.]|nr:hypothetical protein [Chryseolinea sp.]